MPTATAADFGCSSCCHGTGQQWHRKYSSYLVLAGQPQAQDKVEVHQEVGVGQQVLAPAHHGAEQPECLQLPVLVLAGQRGCLQQQQILQHSLLSPSASPCNAPPPALPRAHFKLCSAPKSFCRALTVLASSGCEG